MHQLAHFRQTIGFCKKHIQPIVKSMNTMGMECIHYHNNHNTKKKKVNEWSIKNRMWFLVRSLLHPALLICEVLLLETICNFESKKSYVHLSFKYNVWALVSAFLIYEVKIKCTWLHQSPMIYVLLIVATKSISSNFFKFLYYLEGEQL